MKQVIGVMLVIVGIAYFTFRGFHYPSQEVVAFGPLQASRTVEMPLLPYSPVVGGAIIAGGAILFITGTLQRAIWNR